MSRCSRQWVIPAITASRDSLAPCMKKSRAIASLVSTSKLVATVPRTGAALARTTIPRMATT